ncbi:MAG: FIG049476: HIT family protein [uncultured Thermomicrobiales bacterium]|uniref:FIG049476: HIT family protein n=1 Tax=uncultured Thermomicrobiales bacterium TaxID=1645740 RepID=A0A6J4TRE3_9BACT|nr:MAG: FIG049476: HIT family protein [uncultured Thermomicrobiales bacterium]
MRYVGGGGAETGCLFCTRLAADDDVRSLIVHRGERAFAILNLFPYNTGHLMLVPNDHVASPEGADPAAMTEIAALLPPVLRALRRVFGCDGFNVGLNVGNVAGAGVADHLHQHVVPRWTGDANFMPILAATMVLPELIPVTFAKIRAELGRELAPPGTQPAVVAVLLSADHGGVFLPSPGDRLPSAPAGHGEPLWRAAVRALGDDAPSAELVGWAGPTRATPGGVAALAFRAGATGAGGYVRIEEATELLVSDTDRAAVVSAVANLAPSVAAP